MNDGETTEDLLGDACTICLEEKDSNMSRHVGCSCILCDSCIAVSVDLTHFKQLVNSTLLYFTDCLKVFMYYEVCTSLFIAAFATHSF